jgi:hypothetical protein
VFFFLESVGRPFLRACVWGMKTWGKKNYMICGRYSTPTVIKSTYIRINVRLNVRKPANIWNEFISVAQIVRWCYHASRTVISATSKLGPSRPLPSLLGLAACAFGGEVGFRLYDVSPYPFLQFIHSPVRDCSRRWNWFCVPGSAIYRGGSGLFHPLSLPQPAYIKPPSTKTCEYVCAFFVSFVLWFTF